MIKLISNTKNLEFSKTISKVLGIGFASYKIKKFPNKEISVEFKESFKDEIVYVIGSVGGASINDNFMELFILISAVRGHSPKEIILIIPYLGYSRQDRAFNSFSSIPGKTIAEILQVCGVSKIITVDLHSQAIERCYSIPIIHLSFCDLIIDDIKRRFCQLSDIVIVSPDRGGIKRAKKIADYLQLDFASINKRRDRNNQVSILTFTGNVHGKICILVDDIIDSAETLCKAAAILSNNGAQKVYSYVTHGLFTGDALKNITISDIEDICISDSLKVPDHPKIRCLSLVPIIASYIKQE